jgi:hypothetical protein
VMKEAISEDVEWVLESLRRTMVGAVFVWEPMAYRSSNTRAYARVKVVSIDYNGDEITVTTDSADRPGTARAVNDLARFMEGIAYDKAGDS